MRNKVNQYTQSILTVYPVELLQVIHTFLNTKSKSDKTYTVCTVYQTD